MLQIRPMDTPMDSNSRSVRRWLRVLASGCLAGVAFANSPDDAAAGSGKCAGLHYEVAGRGDVIVFLHGGQMDGRMWDAQFNLFARHHRVMRCDLRGFGQSDVPLKPYSHIEDLRALFDHLHIRRAALVGLSLGAATAVDFALTCPERVSALVLTCPGLGGFSFQDGANDLRAIVEAVRDGEPDKAAELWLRNPYMSVAMENPALHDKLRTLARSNTRCWLNNPLLLKRLTPAAAGRLREVRAPTLVVGGDRDVPDIHHIVDKLTAEIPGARKKVVTGAGHLVPMEKPEEFNALALEFLAGIRSKPAAGR